MMRNNDSITLSRRCLLIGVGGLAATSLVTPAYGSSDLVVIVHPNNKEAPSLSDLAAMFTTRKQSWGGGARVVPFNFPPKHPVRTTFDQAVLGMDADDVARYWIDRRIRGGNAPPKQVGSAPMIVRLVEKLEGAVGYVPRSSLSSGVRVVQSL